MTDGYFCLVVMSLKQIGKQEVKNPKLNVEIGQTVKPLVFAKKLSLLLQF